MAAPVVLAIDGNSLVHRSFHAQARTGMRAADGRPAWAVRGVLTQLVAAVERVEPVCVCVGFDDPDRSWRRERWPGYKAHRTEKLDTLVEQLADAVATLRRLGLAVAVPEGLEADDVLASARRAARELGARTVIMTSDRDAFALIAEDTAVLRIINGGVEASPLMTPQRLVLLAGVRPEQYRDYAALRGDPSDNLAGVRGVGPRTAARLLAEFGSAAAAFDDLDAVRDRLGGGVAARLADAEARPAWSRNCEVMTMREDVTLDLVLRGGPGCLPLAAEPVSAIYREHNLTWTTSAALRVLADTVSPAAPPPVARSWQDEPTPAHSAARRALPRLAPPPQVEQLSLFDTLAPSGGAR